MTRFKEIGFMPLMKKIFLILGIIFYILIFLLYYPPIFAFKDESSYLSMAYVLKKGTIFIENTDIPVQDIVKLKGHTVPFYPLCQSLLLIPLIFLGYKGIFLLGIGFHLLGVLFFIKLIRLFKLEDSFLPFLYLFFPAFVFYSRTIMADIPSTTLLLIAYYFYFKPVGSKFVSGLFFGAATMIRSTNLIAMLSFSIILIMRAISKREYKKILYFFCGVTPFILLLVGLNYLYYGSPVLTGYLKTLLYNKGFSFNYLATNFQFYFVALLLCYPFMLFSVFFARKTRKSESLLSIIFFISFYSLYYFHDRFPNKLSTYVLGIRFLFPVVPLILLSYSEFLNKILQKFSHTTRALTIFFISVCLLTSQVIINHQHQQFLKRQLVLKEAIYKLTEDKSVVIYDKNTAELIQKVWGDRIYIKYEGYNDLLEHLKMIHIPKSIYLIKRDVIYAGRDKIEGISREDIAWIKQHYSVKEIWQEDGLIVFRLVLLSG